MQVLRMSTPPAHLSGRTLAPGALLAGLVTVGALIAPRGRARRRAERPGAAAGSTAAAARGSLQARDVDPSGAALPGSPVGLPRGHPVRWCSTAVSPSPAPAPRSRAPARRRARAPTPRQQRRTAARTPAARRPATPRSGRHTPHTEHAPCRTPRPARPPRPRPRRPPPSRSRRPAPHDTTPCRERGPQAARRTRRSAARHRRARDHTRPRSLPDDRRPGRSAARWRAAAPNRRPSAPRNAGTTRRREHELPAERRTPTASRCSETRTASHMC